MIDLPPPPAADAIRRLYRVLSVMMFLIGAPLFALLPLHFAGLDLPVWPPLEASNYLAATGGTAVLGLAWFCRRVAIEPELSHIAAAPLSIVFFGWAMVRYLTFFFGEELVGRFGPGILLEVIVFCSLGALVAIVRTDARTNLRGTGTLMMASMKALPTPIKLWLVPLVGAVVAGPFLFLGQVPAQMMAAAQILNMAGFALNSWHGWQRILGLSHLFAWTPAYVVVARAAGSGEGAYGAWLWAATVIGGICLLIDLVDTLRWASGDRSELVSV